MSQEIFCTSAPRGLKPGSKGGFCTVAATAGIPGPLAEQLERLSAYRPFYPVGHASTALNPVSHAHWRVTSGGRTLSVLSRVAFAIDYSQRTSRFAHHIVLEASEQSPAGPAWVMMQPGVMQKDWIGEPQVLPAGRRIPAARLQAGVCTQWASVAGDAGWAGVLAEAAMLDLSKPAYILFAPGTDLLPLINEALLLLPERLRWEVTFNTYFTGLPSGLTCAWRCCVSGSDAAKDAARLGSNGFIIDLTKPVTPVPAGPYVERARTGRSVVNALIATSPDGAGDPLLADASHPGDHDGFAVSSAAGAPRRRLSGPASEEYEIEHPSDRTAPPVYRHNVNGGRRGGARALLWVVSLLWPLVVAAFVLVLIRQREAGDRLALPTTTPDENGRVLEDRVRQLQSELEAARSSLTKRTEELNDIRSTWLSPEAAAANATGQQSQKSVPTSAPALAPAQEPKTVAAEQAPPAVADSSVAPPTDAASQPATAPQALPLYDALPTVSLPPRQHDGLGKAKGDAIPVHVTVPSRARQVDVAWAIQPDGVRASRHDNTLVFIAPRKGMSGEVTIGTLAVTQNPVGLTWRPTHAPAIAGLERQLSSAALVFQDEAGRDIGRAQFCQVVRIDIPLGQSEQRKKAPLHLPSGSTWQLVLMKRPSRWDVQMIPDTTSELKFQDGGDAFTIRIANGAVSSDWLQLQQKLEDSVDEARNEEKNARMSLPMRGGSIDEETAKANGQWGSWQTAQNVLKAAKLRRDELSAISCTLGVRLDNGAVPYVLDVHE